MANTTLFEVEGLEYLDNKINDTIRKTLYKMILEIKELLVEIKEEKIFISVEKDYYSNYILVYKKKSYYNTIIITSNLAIVIVKQFNQSILIVFDLHYQELAKDVI